MGIKPGSVNYRVCCSISEAFVILDQAEIDLILTGIELSDGTASELLGRLNSAGLSDIPVILLTADDNLKVRNEYFSLGVVDFIIKNETFIDELNEYINFFHENSRLMSVMQDASIAVLDDSKFSIQVIKSTLSLAGINNPDVYEDPVELIETQKKYDIYLLDMVLPNMSGKQILMKLRKANPFATILMISSSEHYNTILHVLETGADDYIIKPFDSRMMLARLKTNFRTYLLIKDLQKQKDIVSEMSVTDSLTGAKNRRFIFERLDIEINNAIRTKRPLSILMIDLDNFKSVNDNYGHPMGDLVLKALAELFMGNIRPADTFSRYGGEEFMLIMPATPIEAAQSIALRLKQLFVELEIDGFKDRPPISFSGGLVEWKGEELDMCIKLADDLLYKAKSGGKNTICI